MFADPVTHEAFILLCHSHGDPPRPSELLRKLAMSRYAYALAALAETHPNTVGRIDIATQCLELFDVIGELR